jgi:hypothetical protein
VGVGSPYSFWSGVAASEVARVCAHSGSAQKAIGGGDGSGGVGGADACGAGADCFEGGRAVHVRGGGAKLRVDWARSNATTAPALLSPCFRHALSFDPTLPLVPMMLLIRDGQVAWP